LRDSARVEWRLYAVIDLREAADPLLIGTFEEKDPNDL